MTDNEEGRKFLAVKEAIFRKAVQETIKFIGKPVDDDTLHTTATAFVLLLAEDLTLEGSEDKEC